MPELSDLDRDLGLTAPCDLNIFWILVAAADRGSRQKHSLGQLLRLRYTPGGKIWRTWAQIAAPLHTDAQHARNLVDGALRAMYRRYRKNLTPRRN